ncbi:MAG: hypothetical protein IBX60_02610 [Candidatus Aminicenantes bacterium]|nr:hypothetical protein [Candidatus Aminicenantes bacterium]
MLCLSLFSLPIQDYSRDEALKVIRLLEKIQEEQVQSKKKSLKNVVVTERELNSYIAYRIDVEREEVMKELRFKLFKKNKIEGKIVFDLRGRNTSEFLRPMITLYFGGKIIAKDGKAKLEVKDLYLENEPIKPEVLDGLLYIIAKIEKTEPISLSSWHVLPFGIKNIKIEKGKALFYY